MCDVVVIVCEMREVRLEEGESGEKCVGVVCLM